MVAETQLLTDLRAVRDLLSDPARWTQTVRARNRAGASTHPLAIDAACWCVSGGCGKVTNGDHEREDVLYEALENASMSLYGRTPVPVNDAHGHADVLAMIDGAITTAESEVQGGR